MYQLIVSYDSGHTWETVIDYPENRSLAFTQNAAVALRLDAQWIIYDSLHRPIDSNCLEGAK